MKLCGMNIRITGATLCTCGDAERFHKNLGLRRVRGYIDYSPVNEEICICGHRRGHHNSFMCCVGKEKWNRRANLNEPYCGCHGFVAAPTAEEAAEEAAEAARLEEIEAADKIVRKAQADLWCANCDEEVTEPTAKYECGNCGSEFTYADEGTHRCPDCGKFAAKMDGDFCPDCGEEIEEPSND